MLFKKSFEIVEIYESGVKITHYLHGSKKEINKEIKMYRNKSKEYQMIGKNGMIVWA